MTIRQSATQKLLLSDPFFYFPAGTQSKFNRYLDSDIKFPCSVVRPTFNSHFFKVALTLRSGPFMFRYVSHDEEKQKPFQK